MKHLSLLVVALCCALSMSAQDKSRHHIETAKQLSIFNAIYRDLDKNYVDTLDAKKNIENALLYMLDQLDPYTEYFPEDKTDDLKQMTTGKYAGVGAVVQPRKDLGRCVIASTFEGMPADEAGLRAGDILLSIDGKDLGRLTTQEAADYSSSVSNALRGEPGTTITVGFQRPGQAPRTVQVTRRAVTVPSVTCSAMANDTVGYIYLEGYTENTTRDVRRAIVDLKQQGARRLLLDLRGNPGGLMEEAVSLVNLFVPRGKEVVTTRGKLRENTVTYKTQNDPLDLDIPLLILTNGSTASAAEITAGALQDYDRAVVAGVRTYGKGLVQESHPTAYNGVVKFTTSKYYIPSGRCIQAYRFEDGEPVALPDSLTHEFHTAAGRPVRDGGGITPDVPIAATMDSLPSMLLYLTSEEAFTDYCVDYNNRHDVLPSPERFHLSDADYADFCRFMKNRGFTFSRQSLRVLEKLQQLIDIEGYGDEVKPEVDALRDKLDRDVEEDFRHWEAPIRIMAEGVIMGYRYYARGAALYLLHNDAAIHDALSILTDDARYRHLLKK
jgi:carboxyl-terminal processing protease